MIFAPVIFTAFMSIMLVFTFAIWGMVRPNQDKSIQDLHFVDNIQSSTMSVNEVASSTIEGLKT
ncbi:MAG: hypothetical protein GXP45_03295 [bacterium]|nr:hypothetical protein [bacterium]